MQASQDVEQPQDIAPVDQEQESQTENPAEPMDAESQAANEQLALLQAIPELMEKVANQPWQYNDHIQLIRSLRQIDMKDELQAARQNMHEIYPLTESMWLEWIEDAKKNAPEDREQIKQLYKLATQDYLSIHVWKSYVDYIIANFKLDTGLSSDDDTEDEKPVETKLSDEEIDELAEIVRDDLYVAVNATQYHIAESHVIWNEYMSFEIALLKRSPPTDEMIQRIRSLYVERLQTLHMAWDLTFEGFSTFISQHDNANYEETMVNITKQCARTKADIERRVMSESSLTQSSDLSTFIEYIKTEERWKSPPSRVQGLFERAVAVHCTDASLWEDYVLYLQQQSSIEIEDMITVSERSIRNCPWSGDLWTLYANVFESLQTDKDSVLAIYDRALSNGLLLASYDDLVKTLISRCDFERRTIDWSSENLVEDARPLRNSFKDAYTLVAQAFPKTNDPYYRLEQYEAFIESKLGDSKRARTIWERTIKLHVNEVDAWLRYIEIELSNGNAYYCHGLFKRAIIKELDYPDRLMDAWNKFVHEHGEVEGYREARIAIKRKTMQLSMQWDQQVQETQQAAFQQEVAPRKAAPAPELTPEEKEAKELERKKRIREKSKMRERNRRQRIQQEKAEQKHSIPESRKRRRSSHDDGDEEEVQVAKQPKIAEEESQTTEQPKVNEEGGDEIATSEPSEAANQPTTKEKTKASQDNLKTFIPPAMRRRGPKAAAKAAPARRLAVPKKQNVAPALNSNDQPQEQNGSENKEVPKPKSNDEFRLMFLKQ